VAGTHLTSHDIHPDRSEQAWRRFCETGPGPDVRVLGSNNRLDIVLQHVTGSIGIEVKALGTSGHTGKLTQRLGQTLSSLANRDSDVPRF
jgi:hypothetical protein